MLLALFNKKLLTAAMDKNSCSGQFYLIFLLPALILYNDNTAIKSESGDDYDC